MTTTTTPRAAVFARFPDDVQPMIDIPVAEIENFLDRPLEPRDPIFANHEDGLTTYSTSEQISGLMRLVAGTDWRRNDSGRAGRFLGWYGIDELDGAGMARLTLLSNVECTVYDWCDGHEALDLRAEPDGSGAGRHQTSDKDVLDLGDLSAPGVGKGAVRMAGIDDSGRDLRSVYFDLSYELDREGMLALVDKLYDAAELLYAEAREMAKR